MKYLFTLFDSQTVSRLISEYYIGTSNHWEGATVFWQIDERGRIRTGKIMLYNPATGKRVKEPNSCINWIHTKLKLPDFNLSQCLFGSHHLVGNSDVVHLVESEKTAIIMRGYFPDMLWLATGGKEGLTEDKIKVLAGRKVILYPDLDCYELWRKKEKELSHIAWFTVSTLVEDKARANNISGNYDIADLYKNIPSVEKQLAKEGSKSTQIMQLSFPQSNHGKINNRQQFKNAIIREGQNSDFINCDALFDGSGLTADEAMEVVHEIHHEYGYIIEPEINITPSNRPQISLKQEPTVRIFKDDWTKEIDELEEYFSAKELPFQPFMLNEYTEILNAREFVNTQIGVLRANNGNKNFLSSFERLREYCIRFS